MIGFHHFLKVYLFFCAIITINAKSVHDNHHRRLPRNTIELNNKQTYLLISTSSKIYCMQMPANLTSELSNKYEIIYEEQKQSNNWITDAFYIKSEDLIYVNVYNSTSSSSNIFTLSYDKFQMIWIKKMNSITKVIQKVF